MRVMNSSLRHILWLAVLALALIGAPACAFASPGSCGDCDCRGEVRIQAASPVVAHAQQGVMPPARCALPEATVGQRPPLVAAPVSETDPLLHIPLRI